MQEAVRQGARLLTGGKRAHVERGQYFEPTILADVTPDMRIAHEETFGPVMLLMRVKNEEEALRVANGTAYGLGATVLSKDAARCRRMSSALSVGNVSVNDFGLTYMAMDLPFGGVRGSGFGRLNGREGLRACTNMKAILEDRFPLHVPAKVFPIGQNAVSVSREVLRVLYERRLGQRVDALGKLAGLVLKRGES
ncbi:MAG: aldehyde dehydrogenase family protein [Myxococcales bacterium]